jgi:hypothetical protein
MTGAEISVIVMLAVLIGGVAGLLVRQFAADRRFRRRADYLEWWIERILEKQAEVPDKSPEEYGLDKLELKPIKRHLDEASQSNPGSHITKGLVRELLEWPEDHRHQAVLSAQMYLQELRLTGGVFDAATTRIENGIFTRDREVLRKLRGDSGRG